MYFAWEQCVAEAILGAECEAHCFQRIGIALAKWLRVQIDVGWWWGCWGTPNVASPPLCTYDGCPTLSNASKLLDLSHPSRPVEAEF